MTIIPGDTVNNISALALMGFHVHGVIMGSHILHGLQEYFCSNNVRSTFIKERFGYIVTVGLVLNVKYCILYI